MMGLRCQLCMWHRHFDSLEMAVAAYLFHIIRDHWDYMEKAHNDPEMLDRALEMVDRGLI